MERKLLRQADAARELGVSEGTIRNWLRLEEQNPGKGLLFVRLPSGERRIPASEIERILTGAAR